MKVSNKKGFVALAAIALPFHAPPRSHGRSPALSVSRASSIAAPSLSRSR